MAANIISDTTNDELTREILREMLRQARVEAHLTEAGASLRAGHASGWVGRMEVRGGTPSLSWKWDDVYKWGRAVGRIVRPSPVNINFPLASEFGPFTIMSMNNPDFAGMALLELFRMVHEGTGQDQIELAAALGVKHGTMYALLNSDNPKIATLQRLARALGGELRFELERCDIPKITMEVNA